MKIRAKAISCAVMAILMAMLTVCASATITIYEPDAQTGMFTITYTAGTAGEFYSLVIVEGDYTATSMPAITESNIIYIDQVTADENGMVEFNSFAPSRNLDGTVYLGGSNLEEPILLGKLVFPYTEFVFDSNNVVVQYNGDGGDVILPDGTTSIQEAAFTGKGVTSIKAPSTVTRVFEVIEGVEYYYAPDTTLDFSSVTLGTTYFIIGDFDNDGSVTAEDLQAFLASKAGSKTISTNTLQGDVDMDGVTGLKDIFALMRKLLGA